MSIYGIMYHELPIITEAEEGKFEENIRKNLYLLLIYHVQCAFLNDCNFIK